MVWTHYGDRTHYGHYGGHYGDSLLNTLNSCFGMDYGDRITVTVY
jgi:hypothetical protein